MSGKLESNEWDMILLSLIRDQGRVKSGFYSLKNNPFYDLEEKEEDWYIQRIEKLEKLIEKVKDFARERDV